VSFFNPYLYGVKTTFPHYPYLCTLMTFQEMGLNASVLKAIAELGFETPTPIQAEAIPVMLGGLQDVVALAQTGTGKTAAFGLPLTSILNFQSKQTQALILCPTRELCMQITRDLQNFMKYIPSAHVAAIYGGASIDGQIKEVRRGPQIIVGTPGRMVDMIERRVLELGIVEFVVLDEADEMLHMGFKEDLDRILSETNEKKNTWLFSATMPNEVLRISKSYMHEPVEITVGTKNSGNENIEHLYYVVHQKDKYLALKRIADFNPDIFAIVFCRTKIETQQVADQLIKDGYNADALHGDLSQAQRDFVMKRYRNRTLQMLVATDVAARGIDVNDVTHVINYNLPDEIESYTHRSGRTARAGKSGVSVVLINMKEQYKIKQIEKMIGQKFTRVQVPTGEEVCEQQLVSLIKRVHNVEVDSKGIERFMPLALEELSELSKEEIVRRFMSIEFNRFIEYYRNAPDLNSGDSGREERGGRPGVVKLYMNIGQLDGFDFNNVKEFISQNAAISNSDITWADVKNTFSLIEVRTEVAAKVLDSMHGAVYQGRTVRVESRGNRDAGVSRTRLRSDKEFKGRPEKGSFGKSSDKLMGDWSKGQSKDFGVKKKKAPKSDAPHAYDWNALFQNEPFKPGKDGGEKKKKKSKK
jgi:ATP-dependent RNA helicase DeaD